MNVLFVSYKGGVGKTSLAFLMALYLGYRYVTNDIVAIRDPIVVRLNANTKRIPPQHCYKSHTIFDLGAMSTNTDTKLVQAANLADVIVIPTLTDGCSLEAAIATYNLLKDLNKPIIFIINNYTHEAKCDDACARLFAEIGQPTIYGIRRTTLFERVSHHGREWVENIHNDRGASRLRITYQGLQGLYDAIIAAGGGDESEDA